jgi:hypothetical protein
LSVGRGGSCQLSGACVVSRAGREGAPADRPSAGAAPSCAPPPRAGRRPPRACQSSCPCRRSAAPPGRGAPPGHPHPPPPLPETDVMRTLVHLLARRGYGPRTGRHWASQSSCLGVEIHPTWRGNEALCPGRRVHGDSITPPSLTCHAPPLPHGGVLPGRHLLPQPRHQRVDGLTPRRADRPRQQLRLKRTHTRVSVEQHGARGSVEQHGARVSVEQRVSVEHRGVHTQRPAPAGPASTLGGHRRASL